MGKTASAPRPPLRRPPAAPAASPNPNPEGANAAAPDVPAPAAGKAAAIADSPAAEEAAAPEVSWRGRSTSTGAATFVCGPRAACPVCWTGSEAAEQRAAAALPSVRLFPMSARVWATCS